MRERQDSNHCAVEKRDTPQYFEKKDYICSEKISITV
jgi:hypothetical protein